MAVMITRAPAYLNFAGNPIIVEARTDLSVTGTERSFLRMVCQVFVREYLIDTESEEMRFELSQPVADKGTATFNLSDCVMSRVQRIIADKDMNGSTGENRWDLPVRIQIVAQVYDVYLFENQEVKGDVVAVSPDGHTSRFFAYPGRFTDFELLTFDNILIEDLSDGRAMSRKPDMGIVYKGETVVVPVITSSSFDPYDLSVSVNGDIVASSITELRDDSLDYQYVEVTHDTDGELVVSSSRSGVKRGYYCADSKGVHFLRFINGFGAVENIAVRSKDKLSYEVSGEVHSLVQGISTRPTDRRYATKSQPVGVYELSSGYVSKQWAEWYVQELLASPRVWIQLGGKWIPALVEAEDDCIIYDRTKPGMPHVDFTLRLAIDGVTGATW